VAGRWRYLNRAVLVTEHRDATAARRFFIQALAHGSGKVELLRRQLFGSG